MGHSGVNMPVNANILAQFAQPVRSVNDYMADYERQDANKLAGQRNALMLMQAQQQMAEQQRQAQEKGRADAMLKNLLQQLPSPQQTANQQAFNASGAPLGTVAAAKAQPPVDPRQQIRYQLAQAGAISPTDYIDEAMPKQAAPSQKVVGGSLVEVGPKGVRELYRAPEKPQAAPEIVRIMEFRDSLPQGDPRRSVLDAMITKSTTHAPGATVRVGVNTEKTYAGNIAEGLAKNDVAALDAARSAPDRVNTARSIKQVLDSNNAITGTAAETRLALTKALSTAGLIDGTSTTATEDLVSMLNTQTLEAIKTAGMGSGQGFTDKDRQFLQDAKSGRIEINAATLRRMADLNERAGVAAIQYGNKIAARLKGNPTLGTVGQDLEVKVPDDALSKAIAAEASRRAAARGGK